MRAESCMQISHHGVCFITLALDACQQGRFLCTAQASLPVGVLREQEPAYDHHVMVHASSSLATLLAGKNLFCIADHR